MDGNFVDTEFRQSQQCLKQRCNVGVRGENQEAVTGIQNVLIPLKKRRGFVQTCSDDERVEAYQGEDQNNIRLFVDLAIWRKLFRPMLTCPLRSQHQLVGQNSKNNLIVLKTSALNILGINYILYRHCMYLLIGHKMFIMVGIYQGFIGIEISWRWYHFEEELKTDEI